MARASAGSIFRIDRKDGRPPHYWLILCDPDELQEFLAVSFTDKQNYGANPEVWTSGTVVGASLALTKDSVLQLHWCARKTPGWLSDLEAEYWGQCTPEALDRARCDLCWLEGHLRPLVRQYFETVRSGWCPKCDAIYESLYGR